MLSAKLRVPGQRRAARKERSSAFRPRAVAVLEAPPPAADLSRMAVGHRPRVVVLGSGWGGYSFIKALRKQANADVTLVSQRNFFLYTPLLPGAACGTVEDRSIVEPIRGPLSDKGYGFYEAAVVRIDPVARKVLCRSVSVLDAEVKSVSCELHTFSLEYDVLVLAVGAVPNTFGTPGVEEHAMFFKEIEDALRFRREAQARFERASLPGVTPEQARELLTFCVVGAGPTGVELAAELHDTVEQDVSRLFPASLLQYVSINIVDLQDFVLSSYDRRIAEYATEQFRRQKINLFLGCQVKAVEQGALILADKKTGEVRRVPFGLCVWATGIKMNSLAAQLAASLPAGTQPNVRSLTCDASLRVKGSNGTIFAIGDAATIELKPAAPHVAALLPSPDSQLTQPELAAVLRSAAEEYPHLGEAAVRVEKSGLFAKHAGSASGTVGAAELGALLAEMDRGLRTLPATAQVAKQEGEFLAELISTRALDDLRTGELPEFSYFHKGSLAYVGSDSAVADIPGFSILSGVLAGLVWKSFETISQFSLRNQLLVLGDLLRAKLFGRDLSRV